MSEPQAVATRYDQRRKLWRAAIKWPMYSVAVMPALLASGWRLGSAEPMRWDQLLGFLLAAVLLLLWENLSNDLFDAETGVDRVGKPHSLVNLTGRRDGLTLLANGALLLGLLLIAWLTWRSQPAVLPLVLACCGIGYVYQGPPFRLGYLGLGEPLCWLAFGPLATAAALLVLGPSGRPRSVADRVSAWCGSRFGDQSGVVLHFHQVDEDAAHGKRSPVVRLGTARSAALIPVWITVVLALESIPVLLGEWPLTALLGWLGLPAGLALSRLLLDHHDQPMRISGSKFLALRFQAWNGLGLSLGLAMGALRP